jgi:hypothetical protein
MWLQRAPRNAPSMTIYKTFLLRGYFPKELPPSFFTDIFAQYATTKKGSKMLAAYARRRNSRSALHIAWPFQVQSSAISGSLIRLPLPTLPG